MDVASLHKSLDHNQQNQVLLWTQSLELGAKVSAWIIAANATALLLCFNAILDNRIENWAVLRSLGLVFSLGLALAFFSVLCEQRGFGTLAAALSTFVAKGTNAINLIEQMHKLEAMSRDEATEDLVVASNEVRAELLSLSRELGHFDFNPPDARAWIRTATWSLAGACIALGAGVMSALWIVPGTS